MEFAPPPNSGSRTSPPIITYIMLAIVIWGAALGLGATLSRGNAQALRGLIIFSFPLLFLSFWGIMLWLRNRRISRK